MFNIFFAFMPPFALLACIFGLFANLFFFVSSFFSEYHADIASQRYVRAISFLAFLAPVPDIFQNVVETCFNQPNFSVPYVALCLCVSFSVSCFFAFLMVFREICFEEAKRRIFLG